MGNDLPGTGESVMTVDDDGTREWRNANGQLHRIDGPAVEYADGRREWRVAGQLHREDGPAVEDADGSREWWVNGRRHREDAPTFEGADGTRVWWVNGRGHRTDGPARERPDGTREWWVNGRRHRTDGPAIERPDGGARVVRQRETPPRRRARAGIGQVLQWYLHGQLQPTPLSTTAAASGRVFPSERALTESGVAEAHRQLDAATVATSGQERDRFDEFVVANEYLITRLRTASDDPDAFARRLATAYAGAVSGTHLLRCDEFPGAAPADLDRLHAALPRPGQPDATVVDEAPF